MRRFGYGILAGLSTVVVAILAAYAALATLAPERLPAPALGNLVHMDEKLRFLREHPEFDPTILAVGSSLTWRQIAGEALEPIAGGPGRFLNGATAYLKVHQTRALTTFYLRHYKSVRVVLVMVGLPDFADCTNEPAILLDFDAAEKYAFRHWPPAYFYLGYFTPQRYLRTALVLAEERKPYLGALHLDAWGSSPLQVPKERQRGLRYSGVDPDPACVTEILRLERDLHARRVGLVVVFPPAHPVYRRLHPSAMEWLDHAAHVLSAAGQKTGNMTVLALHADPEFGEADFFDAFHLQREAVRRLSRRIAMQVLLRMPPREPLRQAASAPLDAGGRDARTSRPEVPPQSVSTPYEGRSLMSHSRSR